MGLADRRVAAELQARYRFRALATSPYAPTPLFHGDEEMDEESERRLTKRLTYEMPPSGWRALPAGGQAQAPPVRFVDGTIHHRPFSLEVSGLPRPAVLASVAALALTLEGKRLVRHPLDVKVETVLALGGEGIPEEDRQALRETLATIGVRLALGDFPVAVDYEAALNRTLGLASQQMEAAEAHVLHADLKTPTLVDGLLERRLRLGGSELAPVVGMVKRQHRQYLPSGLLPLLYRLRPGERTPAFLLEIIPVPLVTWYVRLSEQDDLAPGYGLIRLAASAEYLEGGFPSRAQRFAEISAVSGHLVRLRCRQDSYMRAAVSLEPIVLAEAQLRAVMPRVDQVAARLRRLLLPGRSEPP